MNDREERIQRVRTHLKDQVARGPAHMKAVLLAESEKVLALSADLSEAEAELRPAPDEWSVTQVMQHLVGSYERNKERLAALTAGRAYTGPPSRPGMLPEAPLGPFAQVRRLYAEARDAIVGLVENADPNAHLELTTDHSTFGALNWPAWAVFTLDVHARDHVGQIEKVRVAIEAQRAGKR